MKFLQWTVVTAGIISVICSLFKVTYGDEQHQISSKEEMVRIQQGEFLLGSTEKDGRIGLAIGVDEIPQRSLYLKDFLIDKYEVTNRQYKRFVDATGHPVPEDPLHGLYSWEGGSIPEGQEGIPVTYVSWHDADAYCRWAGKRLPAEEEWEKAARGKDGRQWPWGNEFIEGACNVRYAGSGEILPVGSIPYDKSPYGVYDMCGNVSEWTSSWYLPYPGSTLKRESFGETYRVVRGGSWVMSTMPYSRAAYRANTYKPDYKHRGIGFRCAKDAEE